MIKAKLKEPARFLKILETLQDFVGEINLQCHSDGMTFQCIDRGHVCLISVQLERSAFDQYDHDSDICLGINIPNLISMFRIAGKDDTVLIKADDNSDNIDLFFENIAEKKRCELVLKLMDLETDEMDLPDDTQYSAEVRMSSASLSRIVKDLANIGDETRLSVQIDDENSPQSIQFSAHGDIGTAKITLDKTDTASGTEIQFRDLNDALTLSFSSRHLVSISKASALSNRVSIGLSSALPLLVHFRLPGMGNLKYFMAPKVTLEESDEET